jgi:hypothetical protein
MNIRLSRLIKILNGMRLSPGRNTAGRLGDTSVYAKKRYVKIRCIIGILTISKELISVVDQFRHLNGIEETDA